MTLPKISIVTPSYNQGEFIEQTILSIVNQGYPNLEYVIIDGGSTDNTVEVIKKYEHHLKYWISEKDSGQADAINKGLGHCTGEIFNFINSDDYLAENALLKIAEGFQSSGAGAVAGAVWDFDENRLTKHWINSNIQLKELLQTDCKAVYHQPGVWLKREFMEKTGIFDISYHYCFDQEYMYRYLLVNDKVHYIPDTLAYFRMHSASKTVSRNADFSQDFNRLFREFWLSHKNDELGSIARRRSLDYEWPLLSTTINRPDRSRATNFFLASRAILKDPRYRFNRNSIGWLKHILLGARDEN